MSRNPILRFWFNLLFWSYGRGTWQYDVLCGAIIAFLFLTPNSMFFAGIEKDFHNASGKIVGLQKVNSDIYLLLVLDHESDQVNAELEKEWEKLSRESGNRYKRKAFHDEQGRKLGYIIYPR
ncbi:MAG: hypothetical protein AB1714_29025 [Acidobacteriota bacterium]